jgi:hypothetical protein
VIAGFANHLTGAITLEQDPMLLPLLWCTWWLYYKQHVAVHAAPNAWNSSQQACKPFGYILLPPRFRRGAPGLTGPGAVGGPPHPIGRPPYRTGQKQGPRHVQARTGAGAHANTRTFTRTIM